MAKKKKSGTRRGNNEGSIFQRANGQWVGSITTGYNDDGIQQKKTVYGKSRAEVENKLAVYSNRIKTNTFDKLENNTAAELMKEWLLVFKKNTILPRTFQSDMIIYRNHIEPKIRNLKLQDIDDILIQRILNDMIEADYSLSTVKKTKFIFNQFLDYCEQSKWIAFNPAHKVKVRIKDKKVYSGQHRYKALPPEERQRFLDTLNNDPRKFMKALCYTIMFSGLRIGEALGLTWKNVDLKNKQIKIEQAASLIPYFNSNGEVIKRVTQIADTKTACSVREVPLPDILVETLYEWKEKQKQYGLELHKDFVSDDNFVFCEDDCSIRTYSSCRLAFDRFKKAHGFDKLHISFHGLRHTFSNMLFEANENPKVIQALLGHKDVRTTITVYNSVDKDYIRKSTEKFNEQFKVENPKYLNQQTELQPKQEQTTNTIGNEELNDYSEEELDEIMRKLERAKKRKEKDFEM